MLTIEEKSEEHTLVVEYWILICQSAEFLILTFCVEFTITQISSRVISRITVTEQVIVVK